MTKKKTIGLVTFALAGVMTLSSFAMAADTAQHENTIRKPDVSVEMKTDKTDTVKNIFKSKYYFQNKDILKSILNMTDEELKTKLAEHDDNVYKLLEANGKVEEYKTSVLNLVKQKLDKAVADKKMTQEKADEMYAKAEEAVKEFNAENFKSSMKIVTDKASEKLESFKYGSRFSADDLQDKLGEAREVFENSENKFGVKFSLRNSSLAEIIGISEEELKTKLVENGGNIYKVLEEMGKTDEYKSNVLKVTKESLDKAVSNGRITQEEADAIYAKSEEIMDDFDGSNITMFINPDLDFDSDGDALENDE